MSPKYLVEYSTPLRRNAPVSRFETDDPVACEEFINELLELGCRLYRIQHAGADLGPAEFDHMLKTAAEMAVAKRLCASLNIDPDEAKYRFGYAM